MRINKFLYLLLLFICVTSLLCACTAETENTAPSMPQTSYTNTKYDPPITINIVEDINTERIYLPGETYMENLWTRAYEEELGIKFNYLWVENSAQFKERLNSAIASGVYPDILAEDYPTFYNLAYYGTLADLTQVYDNYVSPLTREYALRGDSYGLKNCTINGKLYGIASSPSILPQNLLYIRDDWMRALDAAPPNNMDDVITIARAFTFQDPDRNGVDDTFGMGMDMEIFSGGMDIRGFFNGYKAYPQQWVEIGGKLEWGSIQPEVKDVLATLQMLYAEGIIDKDFASKDTWDKATDLIKNGQVGMFYGANWVPFWTPVLTLLMENNEATWSHYQIPSADGSPGMSWTDDSIGDVLFAFEHFEHPEAVIKIINFINEKLRDPDKAIGEFHTKDGVETFFFSKFIESVPGPAYQSHIAAVEVIAALESGDSSGLNPEQLGYYDKCKLWLDSRDPAGWGAYSIFGPGGTMLMQANMVENMHYHINGYTGPKTKEMNEKSEEIRQQEIEVFTKIIMGAPIELFDDYVEYFHSVGGAMTKEANEWYALQSN